MEDYKNEIELSRVGNLGGSDGAMLYQIATLGAVPRSAHKRLAVAKGLIEQDNITTRVMRYGDFIEQQIFEHLSQTGDGWQSNPLWISNRYSQQNCNLICHPDFVRIDEESHTIYVYECKATKYNYQQTRDTYKAQLFIERSIANELAACKGCEWRVRMFLVHYSTEGVDINDEFTFEPNRITIKEIRNNAPVFDIARAMMIVNDFLETFDYYTEDEVVNAEYLPANVHEQFVVIANALREIKERERQVEDFKARLYDFMESHNIKGVKNDEFSFTLVRPTESASVDYKAIFNDVIAAKTPKKAEKLKMRYKKTMMRKGYVTIKVADNKE